MLTPEEKILKTLESAKFDAWYTDGNFDAYIRVKSSAVSKKQILEDINTLFKFDGDNL